MSKRLALRTLNESPPAHNASKLDSSLKRHTALIKRIKQSVAADNKDQIIKEIESLSIEKYLDEISNATVEGVARCRTDKDVWSAVEVISTLHRRFPGQFKDKLVPLLQVSLAAPNRQALAAMAPEQRDKEDASRISRQRPVLRICAELALVGIVKPELILKALKELLSNDPSLSSLPLLATFLRGYAGPFLGRDEEEACLVEDDIRERFKKMCEGYFDSVGKKLVVEHKRLQEQERRNHEAYIRSGEIFEDRQQAYEKMTRSYEKLLGGCQNLSELLSLPMPELPKFSEASSGLVIGVNTSSNSAAHGATEEEDLTGSKWIDEEEKKFYEDVMDLKEFVPKGVLGVDEEEKNPENDDLKKISQDLDALTLGTEDGPPTPTIATPTGSATPISGTPLSVTVGLPTADDASQAEIEAPGPSQLLTALLARLPDATNRELIDQAAIDFVLLNRGSKAGRRRIGKFLSTPSKSRLDLIPYYARLVATLNKYMSDVGNEVVAALDEEFRYLQRKKNVVIELAEVRRKNITYLSALTKFRIVPSHLILHMFKVCSDDFSVTNVENIALLLEGCGRFLLRSEDTGARFATMLDAMRRKQSMQHLDSRQELLLENAYYQCNPPSRPPIAQKVRPPIVLFIRHLIQNVLSRKSLDKVLKLLRRLDWSDPITLSALHSTFTKPWKIKYSNVSLLAMLVYDLQRYHQDFTVGIVDQVMEDLRRGMEVNSYRDNQKRVATIKYLGELYIYRVLNSGMVFDVFWSLVTFGHVDGRPLPHQHSPIDMPDDFFRIRLVCVLLDTCGMCFDRGTQRKKLDAFLVFLQYYVHCKSELPMDIDFMLSDSLEAVRPKFQLVKTIEEAAVAVDDMLNSAFQVSTTTADGDDSGDESEEEDERGLSKDDEGDDEDVTSSNSPMTERAPSPDEAVVLSTNNSMQENLGPDEEAEAEFAKEFAKMVTDTSNESRKVDKKTALAMWDSSVLAPGLLRGKARDENGNGNAEPDGVMNFTIVTKKGNKQQTRQLAVPATSALAIHTRTAQMQDKVEQQQLKKLVLDYEQREEAEEMKAFESRNRAGAIKIRYG